MDRYELGDGFELRKVNIADLKEQDVNAHYMPSARFNRLSENIRKRSGLQSLPLCAQPGGNGPIEIVSGHHRIRAARAAGLEEIWVLIDTELRTRSAVISAQLAHNALVGSDDQNVIAELIKQIDNPDDLLASGLSDDLPQVEADTLQIFIPHLDFQEKVLSLAFLPHQMENWEKLLDSLDGRQDQVGVVSDEIFESFLEAAAQYAKVKDVKSVGTAIALLTETALREVEDADGAE